MTFLMHLQLPGFEKKPINCLIDSSQLIQMMSGDSDLTSVGPGTPYGAAQSTLSKSHSACIYARDL